MPATTDFQTEQDPQTVADFAKAISHPARVHILMELLNNPERLCGQLVDNLPLAQSTVSQHLRELEKTGIVRARPVGAKVFYSIDPDNWHQARQLFEGFFSANPPNPTACKLLNRKPNTIQPPPKKASS